MAYNKRNKKDQRLNIRISYLTKYRIHQLADYLPEGENSQSEIVTKALEHFLEYHLAEKSRII